MTPDHDIERVLERWLAEGPTRPASRFLEETLDRIDALPRRSGAARRTRLAIGTNDRRLAVAAVVAMLAVGVGAAAILSRAPSSVVGQSPAASAIPSASPRAVVDPAALQFKWVSVGTRDLGHYFHATSNEMTMEEYLIFSPGSLLMSSLLEVHNTTSPDGDGRITTRLGSDSDASVWGCHEGDEGTYAFSLDAAGMKLTLTPLTDACAKRATILAGDWTRWRCPNPSSVCEAELAPGRHEASFVPIPPIDPNASSPPLTPLQGFSYLVPAGWSQLPGQNALARPNDPSTMSISMSFDVAPHSQAANCPDAVEPGVANSVAAMAAWLTRLPGLVSTTPGAIRIGTYDGLMLDVSVAPTWRQSCQFTSGPERTVFTFTDPSPAVDTTLDTAYVRDGLGGDARARYILLDLGKGHNLLIEVDAPDEASWNDLVQAAMPIIDSFEFIP